jgi:maltose/moltooligosaccharide transporter
MKGSKVSFWQIFNMISGFIGIQIAWSLQMINMSYIYENFAVKTHEIAGLWFAAALIGLFGHSIIAYLIDRTSHPIFERHSVTQNNCIIRFWLGKKPQVAQ